MKNEIERKFLVKALPDLAGKEKIEYERYYLFNQDGIELRIQRKGPKFEIEHKVLVSELERTKEKVEISQGEFFESLEELDRFQPPSWFGKEITDTPLARDSQLLLLTLEEFKNRLQETV